MPNVNILSFNMMNVVVLRAVMLSVVAPSSPITIIAEGFELQAG